MALRQCDYNGCQNPAERDRGNCMICASHRCAEHLRADFHSCPAEDDDPDAFFEAYDEAKARHLSRLLATLNVQALEELATRLRNGLKCTIPAFASSIDDNAREGLVASQMGGQNCHLDIEFEDGVTWIARIRLEDPTLPPQPVQDRILLSEIATLEFLARTRVPAPRVYHHSLKSSTNAVGAAFILMEKMPGRALQWEQAAPKDKTRVMEQLVDIFLALEKYPITSLGSLDMTTKGTPKIGGYANARLMTSLGEGLGPFDSPRTAYAAIVEKELAMIASGELSSLPVDNYLSHRWRLDHIHELFPPMDRNQFFLKHFDDKGDHILVDDNYTITGIIDWEFASTEPKALAFSSPCMMWRVGKFYNGENQLSAHEIEFAEMFARRQRTDLSQLVLNARAHQRFQFFLGSTVPIEQDEFESLFQGLRAAVAGEERPSDYAAWRRLAIEKYSKGDRRLLNLLRQERRARGKFVDTHV